VGEGAGKLRKKTTPIPPLAGNQGRIFHPGPGTVKVGGEGVRGSPIGRESKSYGGVNLSVKWV